MAKLTTTDLSATTNVQSQIATINNNFTAVETAMEKTLSRDGTTPNEMEADLDMNGNEILNCAAPSAGSSPVRVVDMPNYIPTIFVQAATPATTSPAQSLWCDTGSTDKKLYQLIGGAWVYTELNLNGTFTATSSEAIDLNFTPYSTISATNIQEAIEELLDEISSPTALTTAFTPAGNISATNVQAALEELDSEKASSTHTHADATISASGFLSASDKTKLDGIESGAQVNVGTDLSYTAATRALTSSTGADVTLPLVTSSDAGLTPASGGGTTNFLRADLTWAVPAGGGGSGSSQPNLLINGDFTVNQRGNTTYTNTTVPANNDDTYLLDRWILLSDGNNTVSVKQESTTKPTNSTNSCALTVTTANKKFGVFQIIEANNSNATIGQDVTVSFKASVSSLTNLDNVKCAIVSWTGTADIVTSDIVSAWGVEGTNPTLVANWTYENTPANLSVTTSFADYSVTANIDTASTKNIGVFIWSDVTTTTVTSDILYLADVQLIVGSTAIDFARRPAPVETLLAKRYYNTSYFGQQAGTAGAAGALTFICYATTSAGGLAPFYPPMRVNPTVVNYNSSTGTVDEVRSNGVNENGTPALIGANGLFALNSTTTLTVGAAALFHYTADAEL